MNTLDLFLCILFVATSAFMSSSEVALFSLSKFQLKFIRDRFKNSYRYLKKLSNDPGGVLSTILVTNEIVNIALSTLISSSISRSVDSPTIQYFHGALSSFIPEWGTDALLGTMITAPIFLIFCEITPKVVAARTNIVYAPMTASPLYFVYKIMSPLRWVLKQITDVVARLIQSRTPDPDTSMAQNLNRLKEEDFLSIVEEAQKEGTVQEHEVELIRNVFELDDTSILEIATPLSRVFSLASTTTLSQALNAVRDERAGQKYSRIPVYGKGKSDIVGVLYSKDLLVAKLEREDPATPVSAIMWRPFTVNENARINTVFKRMKKQRVHMAIIVNPKNQAIGLVTMNDVLEVLLEELIDEDGEGEE